MRLLGDAFADIYMSQLCPWDLSKLEYDGLCSHIPFLEAIAGDFSLSPKELEVQAAQILANRAERRRVASRAAYAQALANDPESLHAKLRVKSRKHAEEHPASVKAAGHRYRAKGKESRKWYCAICDHVCDKQAALTRHLLSTKHHQRASRHCAICKNTFCKKSKYEQHLKSMKHARAVKLALPRDDSTDSTLDSDTEMSMSTSVASKTKSFTQSTSEDFIASSTKTATTTTTTTATKTAIKPCSIGMTQSTLEGFLPSSTATSKTSTATSKTYTQSSLWGFLRSS
jgi:hypothetical protein